MSIIPPAARAQLRSISLSMEDDKLVWPPSKSGEVTASAYRKFSGGSHPHDPMWVRIWHRCMPKNFSLLIWKIRLKALPTDENIRAKGVPLASKCYCCEKGNSGTTEHLFIESSLARSIWREMEPVAGIPAPSSMEELLKVWFTRANPRKREGVLRILAAGTAVWEIWRTRCAAIFDPDFSPTPTSILRPKWMGLIRLRLDDFKESSALHRSTFCSVSPHIWTPHSTGITVNLACFEDTSAAVFRNSSGRFIAAGAWHWLHSSALGGIPILLREVVGLASAQGLMLSEIQWDSSVGSRSDRRWCLNVSGLPLPPTLIIAARNMLARAIAAIGRHRRWLLIGDLPLELVLKLRSDQQALSSLNRVPAMPY